MSKVRTQELMKLDFYEILEIPVEAEEKEIKKSYRKKALKCHPDKNPDNKSAAEEFDQLKKILEILLDPGARKAYDKLLKSRKAAAIRARQADAKTQKLRSELEERERKAQAQPKISEERLRRELKRLEEEGQRIIEEELAKVNQEVQQELQKSTPKTKTEPESIGYKVKVKWMATDEWPGYTEQEIHQLFYKWGEINALVMKQKTKKGTALIDYKTKQGADMAVQFEKGQIGKPVEVTHISEKPKEPELPKETPQRSARSFDFESVAEMNRRREEERRKLIAEILKEEGSAK